MIDFYRKADKKRRGELDFVPDKIEEKFMLLLIPKKNKKFPSSKSLSQKVNLPVHRPRVFSDVYYEHA